jgi:hypothetical protein
VTTQDHVGGTQPHLITQARQVGTVLARLDEPVRDATPVHLGQHGRHLDGLCLGADDDLYQG